MTAELLKAKSKKKKKRTRLLDSRNSARAVKFAPADKMQKGSIDKG